MKFRFRTNSEVADGKPSKKGRIPATIFFFIFGLIGLTVTVLAAKTAIQSAQTRTWPVTKCTIVSSAIVEELENNTPFRFSVRYTYQVGNTTYTGDHWRYTDTPVSDYSKVQTLVDQFPPGLQTQCFVHPENPTESVLEHESLVAFAILLIPLLFLAIGIGGIWFQWAPSRQRAIESTSISAKASTWGTTRFQYGFFLIFFAVGTIVLWFLTIRPLLKMVEARNWIATPCVVEFSTVRSHQGDDSTTYSVDILYSYTFKNRRYKSNQYSFRGGSSSGYQGKEAVVNAHPVGSRKTCFVNPARPGEAVLERGFISTMWFGAIPLLFVLVGAGGLIYTFRQRTKPTEIRSLAGKSFPVRNQPVLRHSGASPLAKLFGTILAALFWNGIVSVFLWQMISGWRTGDPSYFLTLFLIPFVLVGISLILLIPYSFLSLFNPRPTLDLKTPLAPGVTASVSWTIPGSVHRIRQFTITLEGSEEATYRRGTNSITDRETFHSCQLVSVSDPRAMQTGTASISIPLNTMHSFEADNNKIKWTLTLHGKIKFWPDIKEAFDLQVLPRIPEDSRP